MNDLASTGKIMTINDAMYVKITKREINTSTLMFINTDKLRSQVNLPL